MSAYYAVALFLRPSTNTLALRLLGHLPYVVVVLGTWYAAAIWQQLYLPRRGDDLLPQLGAITKAVLLTVLVSCFLLVIFSPGKVDRSFVSLLAMGMLILLILTRSALRLSLWGLRLRGLNTRQILLVGANDTAKHMVDVIQAHGQYGYHLEGFLEDDPERVHVLQQYGVPHLGAFQDLPSILVHRVIDEVYIALPMRSHYETIVRIAQLCEGVGTPVRLAGTRLPMGDASSYLWRLEDIPLLALFSTQGLKTHQLTRRITDWITSSLLILILSPLFLLIAALIKLDSDGPVFTTLPRKRNHNGRVFRLIAFRCTNQQGDPGAPLKLTRIGHHLRRYDLDDLPFLFNVWLGHMSLNEPTPFVSPDKDVRFPTTRRRTVPVISPTATDMLLPATASEDAASGRGIFGQMRHWC